MVHEQFTDCIPPEAVQTACEAAAVAGELRCVSDEASAKAVDHSAKCSRSDFAEMNCGTFGWFL